MAVVSDRVVVVVVVVVVVSSLVGRLVLVVTMGSFVGSLAEKNKCSIYFRMERKSYPLSDIIVADCLNQEEKAV